MASPPAGKAARPGRRAGRVARLAAVLAVALLTVTGCVSMSDGGPTSQLQISQNDTGQNQDYVGAFPAGPVANASPQEIVQGFLFASASYYTDPSVALEFLTPQAQASWKPDSVTVFFHNMWNADTPTLTAAPRPAGAMNVSISGPVQARLNSAGQLYASAAQGSSATATPASQNGACSASADDSHACYAYTLVKVGGQWRISTAPPYLLLDEQDFARGWATQDLYFFDAGRDVLVPDSVFVPIGTSEGSLLTQLASALRSGPPRQWLSVATGSNVFPANITSASVSTDNEVATVNLKGNLSSVSPTEMNYIAAELVWTLTSASGVQTAIQSVNLDVNGTPLLKAQQLHQSGFAGYNPYPTANAVYTYVNKEGEPQSLCGATQTGASGPAVPVFNSAGGTDLANCSASGSAASPPSPQPSTSGTQGSTSSQSGQPPGNHTHEPAKKAETYSMVAVSPQGRYVAVVSAGKGIVSIGSVGSHAGLAQVPDLPSGVTSISWGRHDDLWLTTENGNVWMVSARDGHASQTDLTGVTALSVAPDGVRLALLLQQNQQGSDLEMVAVNPVGTVQNSQPAPHESVVGPTVGMPVALGPGLTGSVAVAWLNANNLIIVGPTAATQQGNGLEEVPVNGRAGSVLTSPQTPPNVTVNTIAAGNSGNMLVAGLSNGQLEVSTDVEGPWQSPAPGSAAFFGSAPVYWIAATTP